MTDPTNPNVIVVSETNEWKEFPKPRENVELDLIVDPMIYRVADVFLRGKNGVIESFPDAGEVEKAIRCNLDSLTMFFDNLILAKNLPIIDYGITFDRHLGLYRDFILQKCNQHDEILVPVHVCDEASSEARDAAIATLKNKTQVPLSLTADLVHDMKSLEHQWHPDLSQLGEIPKQDLPVVRFLYGATLFGVFARNAGVGHLFQPNRSRLFLAAALHADSETAQDDQLLYAKLKQIMTEAAGGADVSTALDGFPPFLPYLLRKNPPTPSDLINEAFALRDTGMVRDYRALRMELISDWREKGLLQRQYQQRLAAIAKSVQKELHGDAHPFPFEVKVKVTGIDPAWNVPVEKLWGWIKSWWPGQRYMKLLTQLAVSKAEYVNMERHAMKIWEGTPPLSSD